MNLPSAFKERTSRLLGESAYEALETALQSEAPTSIRINTAKWKGILKSEKSVPWCEHGYYLSTRPAFTFDPLFHAGCYYVQEAASMFLAQAMKQYVTSPVIMLDLCAAPGGKSTLARSILPEGSLLVSNEIIKNRSQILAENIIKWGGDAATIVTNNDSADFTYFSHLFDVILTDVPCSGEGMFRKDANAITEWSEANVELCWKRQREIIRNIWPTLKPDGILIYSTCTYNREENEDNVMWICNELGAEVLEVSTNSEWNITGSQTEANIPVYRFLPHKTQGEGLFMAVLQKKEEGNGNASDDVYNNENTKSKKKSSKGKETNTIPANVKNWIRNNDLYEWELSNNKIYAFPKLFYNEYIKLKQKLRIVHAGIEVAEVKGKDCIPAHNLAMSHASELTDFPQAELTYEQAIAFLRKEALSLAPETPKGYVVVTYQNQPLGFVKNIGNRANNLYPQEWKIRSGYLPENNIQLNFSTE